MNNVVEAEITGKNITAIILDSGLDINNGYFYRSNEHFQYDQRLPHHSKIEVFYSYSSTGDSSGHGTHVAGILLGKSSTGNGTDSLYNGVAYDAKVAMIGCAASSGDFLNVPVVDKIMEYVDKSGAQVSSNSYGNIYTGSSDYKILINEYDNGMYKRPKVTFAYAAGNNGPIERTISEGCSAVNSICVGNVESKYAEYFNTGTAKDHEKFLYHHVRLLSNNKTIQGRTHYKDLKFNKMADPKIVGRFIKLENSDSDEDIVVISRDHKNEITKAKGKKAAVFIGESEYNMMTKWFSSTAGNIYMRIFAIGTEQGNLDEFYGQQVEFTPFANKDLAGVSMYTSTSVGPTFDGLKKPDVSAVGTEVLSSYSIVKYAGEAKRRKDTGTSMSTPAVGGAAVLIIDYFQQGRFNGKKISPLAATVKAILSASCIPVKKRSYNQDLMWEGHGEVNLHSFLNVDNDPKRRMALGEGIGIKDGQHLILKVKVETSSPLRIGMSYNIKPISPESPIIITSDVSMYVVSPSGNKKYWGNGKEEGATVNEVITIEENQIELGEYEIHLICHSFFPDVDTIVSVVAVGGFNKDMELKFEKHDQCIESCSNHGTCNSGMCTCKNGFYGSACQFQTRLVEDQDSFTETIKLDPVGEKVYEIPIKSQTSSINCQVYLKGGNRNSFVHYSSSRPKYIFDIDVAQEVKSGERISKTIFPDQAIGSKIGGSVFVTVYNTQTDSRDYEVVITGTPGMEPDTYPPDPETSSAKPEVPDPEPEPETSSSKQEIPDPDPDPKTEPETSSSVPEVPEPETSSSASSPQSPGGSSYSVSSPVNPEQPSSGTSDQPSSGNSGGNENMQNNGGISKSVVIAVSVIIPVVVIRAVVLIVILVVSRRRAVGYSEDIDV